MTHTGLLPQEWLMDYAAGSLNEAHAMVVACHLQYHKGLQDDLRVAEDLGGDLLVTNQPEKMAADSLDKVLARLDAANDEPIEVNRATSSVVPSDIPAPLQKYLENGLSDCKWRLMGPGMRQMKLWSGKNGECLWLLKAKGGTQIPVHDHKGLEMTLVLKGSYHVGDDHFTPGLLEMADKDHTSHQPIIDDGEDCICLVATEAPIKIHSLVGRMLQPLIGL